jgi:hypothetical protein
LGKETREQRLQGLLVQASHRLPPPPTLTASLMKKRRLSAYSGSLPLKT